MWTTWPSPKVDESHLYRFLNQCVSVRLYSLGVPLLCRRESTPVLRQLSSLTPSNHSPAERNRSKVDVSMPLWWWMGLTREMMDDLGGQVCFTEWVTMATLLLQWHLVDLSQGEKSAMTLAGCWMTDTARQSRIPLCLWLRKDFCEKFKFFFIFLGLLKIDPHVIDCGLMFVFFFSAQNPNKSC